MVDTTSHGTVEEPSADAQKEAVKKAEEATEVVIDDGIAAFPTAEQGTAAEPSAEAQEAMLDE